MNQHLAQNLDIVEERGGVAIKQAYESGLKTIDFCDTREEAVAVNRLYAVTKTPSVTSPKWPVTMPKRPVTLSEYALGQLGGSVAQAQALDVLVGEVQDRAGVVIVQACGSAVGSAATSRLNSSSLTVNRSFAVFGSPAPRLMETMRRPQPRRGRLGLGRGSRSGRRA